MGMVNNIIMGRKNVLTMPKAMAAIMAVIIESTSILSKMCVTNNMDKEEIINLINISIPYQYARTRHSPVQ